MHPTMDVRTTAAAFLLRHRTAEAMAILGGAAKGEELVAFASAAQALKRWEEGTWALDHARTAPRLTNGGGASGTNAAVDLEKITPGPSR